MSPAAMPDEAGGGAAPDGPGDPTADGPAPDGAAALVPGGRRDQPPADAPEPRTRAARRRRLQALAGLTVYGSDGRSVGRVRDIYQHDAGGELAALTVMPRQLSARSVLIPAAALAALPEVPEVPQGQVAVEPPVLPADAALHLHVDAATARAGLEPPETLHTSPQLLREAAAALGLEEGSAGA